MAQIKFDQLHELKDLLLAHEPKFAQRDYGRKLKYDSMKGCILERIKGIEDLEIKKEGYRVDVNKHLTRMKKILGCDKKGVLILPEFDFFGQLKKEPAKEEEQEPPKPEGLIPGEHGTEG
jgi:hypothetical protein